MQINALFTRIQPLLNWHRARTYCTAALIIGIIKLRTTNLTQLALLINANAKTESNYRRLRRFFAQFNIDQLHLGVLILALLPQERFILTLDRTNWQLGKSNINLLVAAISYKGIAIPILWTMLTKAPCMGKKGNSSTKERTQLLTRLFELLKPSQIQVLLCDREFIGQQWFRYLIEHEVNFVIRIRRRAQIGAKITDPAAWQCFQDLAVGQSRRLLRRRQVYGHDLYVVGLRLAKAAKGIDDLLILVTNGRPSQALALYAQRWQIETLFGALKTRGFDFEATHLTRPERVERLLSILALAFVWATLVGVWLHENHKALPVKKHGRRSRSIFRYGLDHLRTILLNQHPQIQTRLGPALNVLSCT